MVVLHICHTKKEKSLKKLGLDGLRLQLRQPHRRARSELRRDRRQARTQARLEARTRARLEARIRVLLARLLAHTQALLAGQRGLTGARPLPSGAGAQPTRAIRPDRGGAGSGIRQASPDPLGMQAEMAGRTRADMQKKSVAAGVAATYLAMTSFTAPVNMIHLVPVGVISGEERTLAPDHILLGPMQIPRTTPRKNIRLLASSPKCLNPSSPNGHGKQNPRLVTLVRLGCLT